MRDLYHHMEWADATIWSVVLARPECANDEALRAKLYHIHTVQRAFFNIWNELPMKFPEAGSFADLHAMAAWGKDNHREIGPYVDGIEETQLDEVVELPWAARLAERFGSPGKTSFRETLIQVAMHSQYHRGQVNTRIRELGGEPPLVDYIAWLWYGRPAPDWPV